MGESVRQVSREMGEKRRLPFLADLLVRLVREKPLGTVGGAIVLVLLLAAIFADLIAPYGMNEQIMAERLQPPSATHIFGTDNLGRDLLSRIIYGARISLYVGLGATILASLVEISIGLVCGFFGGKVDLIMQRFVDAWFCFPAMFVYLTVMALLGPGLIQVIIVLGIHRGIHGSRIVRGAVIAIRANAYFEAARAIGASNWRVLYKHILPNTMPVIVTLFAVTIGGMILAESTLSFLGFGIPPPTPSWGGMLSGAGRTFMLTAPWMAFWPGLALAIVVYGLNMLGDALRDLLDPRLKGGLGRYGLRVKTK